MTSGGGVKTEEEIKNKISTLVECIIVADPVKEPPPVIANLYLTCSAQIKALRWVVEDGE